jgi:acyl carrier protein
MEAMTDEIDSRIKSIFCDELGLDDGSVDDATSYDSTEAWDSLRHLQLVSRFEEEFGIELPVDDVIAMSTFKKVREIVKRNLANKGAT